VLLATSAVPGRRRLMIAHGAVGCKRLSGRPHSAWPPATWTTWPVIHRACSLANKSTTSAMSAGVPRRRSGMVGNSWLVLARAVHVIRVAICLPAGMPGREECKRPPDHHDPEAFSQLTRASPDTGPVWLAGTSRRRPRTALRRCEAAIRLAYQEKRATNWAVRAVLVPVSPVTS